MKHGDQGKGKTAKAASQASGKSGKAVTALKGGKAGQSSKAAGENGKGAGSGKGADSSSKKAGAKESGSRLPVQKADPAPVKKDDKGRRPAGETGGFTNPVVASAFKRAVAKYPNAFRKLTD